MSETGSRPPHDDEPAQQHEDPTFPAGPAVPSAAAAPDPAPADAVGGDAVGGDPGGFPVVDDPDVPTDPDDRTLAAAAAAQAALRAPAAGRRPYRGPRSILVLLLVIAGVLALGAYAVVWADRLRIRHERIELRELGRRHVMSEWQRRYTLLRFGPDADVQPAGVVYKPLVPAERARYDALVQRHPPQFEPNEIERGLIEDTKRLQAAYGPATRP